MSVRIASSPMVLAFLLALLAPAEAVSQEAKAQEQLPDLELDKLYTAKKASFQTIANRLLKLTRAKKFGKDESYVRFELFESVWTPGATSQYSTSPGYWSFMKRGDAAVVGKGMIHPSRVVDIPETKKELRVSAAPGKPRTIWFRLQVQASDEHGDKDPRLANLLGREVIEVQIIQHPGDKSVRVVLDPLTFRRHQSALTSNWVEEEAEPPKKGSGKKVDGKKTADPKGAAPEEKEEAPPPAAPPGPEDAARAEITAIKSFKAEEGQIVVHFRRKWQGLENKVVDGALFIDMDSTLSSALFYWIPGKSGKLQRFRAAHFQKGHRIE